MFPPVKIPLIFKKIFRNYVWNLSSTDKVIYLTFDDGPTPKITDWVLDTLKSYNAKATFFCIGNNIDKHHNIFQRIIDEGHSIGNHTYNHLKGWKTKTNDYLKNVAETESAIENQTQNLPDYKPQNLFRPPYGQLRYKQGKALVDMGYNVIMWDVLSFDWEQSVSQETCLKNVTDYASNGSIIVFHDSEKASKNMQYALPGVLDFFSKLGYSFEAIKSSQAR